MSQERQCVNCKTYFDDGRRFCPRCGTYWKQRKQTQGWAASILNAEKSSTDPQSNPRENKDGRGNIVKPERFIVCERCRKEIPVADDILPDFCCFCNNLIDGLTEIQVRQPISDSSLTQQAKGEREISDDDNPERNVQKKSPLRPAKKDSSEIGFVWMGPEGNVRLRKPMESSFLLGLDGTYESPFFTNPSFIGIEERQAEIHHNDAGWYIRALGKNVRHNNVEISTNNQQQLKDGDLIHLGNCTLSIEIRLRMK